MNNLNKNGINGLNNLISRNKDASKGFVDIAYHIKHVELKKFFVDWANDHESNATKLQKLVASHGGEPVDSTSLLGELHHTWIDLKAYFSNNNTDALIDECLNGEEKALSNYAEVKNEILLPANIISILSQQESEIRERIKELKLLKASFKYIEAEV